MSYFAYKNNNKLLYLAENFDKLSFLLTRNTNKIAYPTIYKDISSNKDGLSKDLTWSAKDIQSLGNEIKIIYTLLVKEQDFFDLNTKKN